MPQPKSSRTTKPAASTKKPAVRKPAAKKPAPAAKPAAAAKATSARKPAAAKKTAAPRKKPAPARKPAAKPAAAKAQANRGDDALRANLAQLLELFSDGVMLTAQRIQDAMDEAVRGGHMTRHSAEDLARGLVDAGRKQTQDVVADIEQLIGRSRPDLGAASSVVRDRGDRVLREVDKVRRTAGLGPSFPILGYDDLTAAQVVARVSDLKGPELRKVRDHERRNANRKSVLGAIEKALR